MESPCIPTLELDAGGPAINLKCVYWKKDFLNARNVSIDIVPAIQVKSWWPTFARQDSSILTPETKECHIVLKQPIFGLCSTETFGNPAHLLRVSFSVAELELFHKMPPIVKRSCVVAKVLLKRKATIPSWMIFGEEFDRTKVIKILNTKLSSYVLKNALFHELEALYVNDSNTKDNISSDNVLVLKTLICGTFRRLTQATEELLLPAFFVPSHNLFETYKSDDRVKVRYLAMQLLNMSLQDGCRRYDVKIKDFPERRNNGIMARRHLKSVNILTKLGTYWIN
jgi:hypothetical protein